MNPWPGPIDIRVRRPWFSAASIWRIESCRGKAVPDPGSNNTRRTEHSSDFQELQGSRHPGRRKGDRLSAACWARKKQAGVQDVPPGRIVDPGRGVRAHNVFDASLGSRKPLLLMAERQSLPAGHGREDGAWRTSLSGVVADCPSGSGVLWYGGEAPVPSVPGRR